jgi:cysteine desulfurase
VAHLTDNYAFEGPLSTRVREAISSAFEQGWGDPKKLSQASHRALELRTSAVEEFAAALGTSPANIEIVGEPNLLHHLALNGFLAPDSHLFTSTIDVGKIRAVARAHSGQSSHMPVDSHGKIAAPSKVQQSDLISLQATNGETGISQNLDTWRNLPARIALDATRAIPTSGIAEGFSSATFDAQAWGGPQGLGFLLINEREGYRYSLAHIAPIRVPGSYSLPLALGSVIALSEYRDNSQQIHIARNSLALLFKEVPGVTVIGDEDEKSRYLSIIVEGVSGEEVLRTLLRFGITLDAGSACSPEDLTPSHVIAALGFPTTGHLRLTIHAGTTIQETENLANKVREVLRDLSN